MTWRQHDRRREASLFVYNLACSRFHFSISGVLIHETRRLSMSSSTFAHLKKIVVVVLHALPPYMHSLPFLDDVDFVFVVASLAVDQVSVYFFLLTFSPAAQTSKKIRFSLKQTTWVLHCVYGLKYVYLTWIPLVVIFRVRAEAQEKPISPLSSAILRTIWGCTVHGNERLFRIFEDDDDTDRILFEM